MREHTLSLREALLEVMDAKDHWAWGFFARGEVPLDRLATHFEQEWEVYVRDFPVMLGRVLGHGPPDDVRVSLASNLYEEQTGGISRSEAHPALFLKMMEGCGYDRARFTTVTLGPRASAYRTMLDEVTFGGPWIVGCAVMTLFVEGSVNDRKELAESSSAPPDTTTLEALVRAHPLVRVHHVSPDAMELMRVHRRVEGGHRHDAWHAVLDHAQPHETEAIVGAMRRALTLWKAYRDEVSERCGLSRPTGS